MRIAFIIHTPKSPQSAVYNHYKQVAEYLKRQAHFANIIAPQDFPSLNKRHARWFVLLYPFYIWKWLKENTQDFDIISFHSYTGWVVNFLRAVMPRFRRLQFITDFHGLEPLYYEELRAEMERINNPLSLRFRLIHGFLVNFLIRFSCRRSDLVMCRNSHEVRYLIKNSWADSTKILLVGNTVSSEFFIQRTYSARARRLLITAQWSENKGIKYLVEAFSKLAHERPGIELWCVGTLLDENQVLKSFPPDVQNRVVVRPRVAHSEIVALGKEADIFVFPTLTEGFSIALLEAMAMGLPIITTRVGAAEDLLEDEVSTLFVPVRNAEILAHTIERLLDDQVCRERLGKNAASQAARYELNNEMCKRLSVFQRLLFTENLKQNQSETIKDCSTH